jgi:hypothetical protein
MNAPPMPSMNTPASNNSTPNNTKPLMGGRRRNATRKNRKNNMNVAPNMMGGAKMPAVGSKAQVFHGTARHTSGGLVKKDLVQNKHGRIVSRRKMALGKKALKHLVKAGYKAKKGTFKLMKKH